MPTCFCPQSMSPSHQMSLITQNSSVNPENRIPNFSCENVFFSRSRACDWRSHFHRPPGPPGGSARVTKTGISPFRMNKNWDFIILFCKTKGIKGGFLGRNGHRNSTLRDATKMGIQPSKELGLPAEIVINKSWGVSLW